MDVLFRLILAQATRLAREGSYARAEALLDEAAAAAGGPRADVLDLRARIRAQQGRYPEAAALWRDALALAPERADWRASLELVERSSPARTPLAGVAARAAVALALVLLAWTAAAQRLELGRLRAGAGVAAGLAQTAASSTAAGGSPQTASTVMPPEGAPAAPSGVASLLDSLETALESLEGVTRARDGSAIQVRFDEALFSEGAALRPGASASLESLGGRLAPFAGRIAVEILGHTDPIPVRAGSPYGDNTDLGLARASRVASLLLRSGLSTDVLSIGTRGDGSPPYSNETSEGMSRNRTVTLRISPGA